MQVPLQQKTSKALSPGGMLPLGATVWHDGINFSVTSRYAEEVYLLLFDVPTGEPTDIVKMNKTGEVGWCVFVHGIGAGQLYGYKVLGRYDPGFGLRFNIAKLLMDPYAKAVTGKLSENDHHLYAFDRTAPGKDLVRDDADNTLIVPKSIAVGTAFDWQDVPRPDLPLENLIVYETHLKGFTAHTSSKVQHPGTYLGFIEKIPYLKELGINAVELLPVFEFHSGSHLTQNGLHEYWGYNTIGFFAPESSYAADHTPGAQVNEFKTMVRELHRAGIEVILDVVYNHTAEGNELGPTISFKGIDNPSHYLLAGSKELPYRHYINDTGCGNTMNIENPDTLRFVLASLRYWVEVMQVDGFRFDLATVMGKHKGRYSKRAPFFKLLAKDPVLRKVKFIAEPWDLSTYQLGNFPHTWAEWNGSFRDTARRFLKGDTGQTPHFMRRVSGSDDLFGDDGRYPYHSINYITCHDGFTLHDLYAYNHKHNEQNREQNRDGTDSNYSWNCGVEGESEDPSVLALRKQLAKNALCCVLFSAGTPMILGGDEFLRTQHGNNNAYCQDNDISWFNWDLREQHRDMYEFVCQLIALRKRYAVFVRRSFFHGADTNGDSVPDIAWYGVGGLPPVYEGVDSSVLCYMLDAEEHSDAAESYRIFIAYNASLDQKILKLPVVDEIVWKRIIDTSKNHPDDFLTEESGEVVTETKAISIQARTTMLFIGSIPSAVPPIEL